MKRTIIALVITLAVPGLLMAQTPPENSENTEKNVESFSLSWNRAPLDGPIFTDRPHFSESPHTVPRGRVQLEMGYTFTRDSERGNRSESHTLPEFLLRIGLADRWELRIGWNGYTFLNERGAMPTRSRRFARGEDSSQGAQDLLIGFKHTILEQGDFVPHFGIIPAMTVPIGSAGFSSGDVEPEIKLAWEYDLSERANLEGNVNFAAPTDDGDRFFQTSASISFGYSLTEKLGSFIEYYGFYPSTPDNDCAHTLNGGFTFLLTENMQFDWRAGFGLNEEADDFFTGVGLSVRF